MLILYILDIWSNPGVKWGIMRGLNFFQGRRRENKYTPLPEISGVDSGICIGTKVLSLFRLFPSMGCEWESE